MLLQGQMAIHSHAYGGTISVLVRPPSGAVQRFDVRSAELVGVFKSRVAAHVGVPVARQSLVLAGRVLEDARKLGEYNLDSESELLLLLRDTVDMLRDQLIGKQVTVRCYVHAPLRSHRTDCMEFVWGRQSLGCVLVVARSSGPPS